ncbi:MAG TPA: sugar phosphate isomerase/epimerase family protein [Actinomycetota bacterium]|jgi:sugar phosphate isomerase/epimerase|nr:sugar phosphate isomerase/epimerase family protein [Actinomycetota bacterium]
MDTDRAFATVKAAGAEAVEVMVTQSSQTQSPNELERLAQRHDLPIVAVHAPQLLLTRSVFGTNPLEKIRRTAELCNALDVKTIVLHPPYVWQPRYALWLLHELEDVLDAGGPAITMENMYPVHVGSRRLRFHRFGGLEGLKRFRFVTLDTSHLAVSEENIVDAYRRLDDRVVHIHLSDNRGKGRDSHAPLGKGVLPIEEFVRALDRPVLRSIALEIEPGPNVDDAAELERLFGESLDLLRRNLPVPKA